MEGRGWMPEVNGKKKMLVKTSNPAITRKDLQYIYISPPGILVHLAQLDEFPHHFVAIFFTGNLILISLPKNHSGGRSGPKHIILKKRGDQMHYQALQAE
jgi:hypothetical protein